MPMNLPSMEVGGGYFSKTAPPPKEPLKKVSEAKAREQAAFLDYQGSRQVRHKDFGSLFKKENQTALRNLNAAGKFITTRHDERLFTSFSGSDTKMSIAFRGGKPIYVGEAQTVTYSLYRPTEPVYVLGSSYPNGFVKGQRTVAGSIIFTVFDRNVLLNAFYNAYSEYSNSACVNQEYLTDELPPFDIHLTFMNEHGISAALVIYGCHIPSEGQVHSVEDMITENTIQYVARDITLMRPGDIT